MIKNIIFDLGNVIMQNPTIDLVEEELNLIILKTLSNY